MMKLKWLTSLLILLALTGPVWAGVCGCFAEREKGHSCCKKGDNSGDYMAGKSCCSADCEFTAGAAGKIPQKQNQDAPNIKAPAKAVHGSEPQTVIWLARFPRQAPATPGSRAGDNGLRLARGPDLYLRHNSFLI